MDGRDKKKSIATTGGDVRCKKTAKEKTRRLNADLQKNVSQLKVANKELESFSYSISHDLRAPLRILDGNSAILLEDYAHHLEEEPKRLLGTVRQNVRKMNNLIDHLLKFSKL